MAIELTLGGALRGAGDTRYPLFATFCGLVVGRVGLAALCVSLDFSVYWVFGVLVDAGPDEWGRRQDRLFLSFEQVVSPEMG